MRARIPPSAGEGGAYPSVIVGALILVSILSATAGTSAFTTPVPQGAIPSSNRDFAWRSHRARSADHSGFLPRWSQCTDDAKTKRGVSTLYSSKAVVTPSNNTNNSVDPAVVRRLNNEMADVARRQRRYEEELTSVQTKLNEANAKLSLIENRKNEYLDGGRLGDVFNDVQNFYETTLRSAVKAMMWRIIAGLVTLATSFRFSKSLSTALSIVGSDFLSKAITMFIGERLMNRSQAGRKSGADDVGRSLVKALVWRLFAICNTLAMSILIAKDVSMASKIAGSDAIFKTALMFMYERLWAKIEWGKKYQIEYAI